MEVLHRCGDACFASSCASMSMNVNLCTKYCSPCNSVCSGYYYLYEDNDNGYKIKIFDSFDSLCENENILGTEVICDKCVYDNTDHGCNSFYLECTSYWWVYLLVGFGLILICAIVAGLMFVVFKKVKEQKYSRYNDHLIIENDKHSTYS